MGDGGKSGGAKQDCYFGTIACAICAGPVDELVGIVIDGKLVWPDAPAWADGLVHARTTHRQRQANIATVWMEREHGLKTGDKVTLSGFTDASFNANAVTVTVLNAFSFSYSNAGPNVSRSADSAGRLTKNVAYAPGDLVHDGATIWECATAHTSSPSNRPPHSYWSPYALRRADVGDDPYPITIPDWGALDFYWGTSTQTLLTDGDPSSARDIFAAAGHPPYRRQCWALLRDFKFGVERQAAPNIEFIVRRKAQQSLLTGSAAALAEGQSNPLAALAELITSPYFGLGLSRPPLDPSSWQATASDLADASDRSYLSVLLTYAESLRAIALRLIAYYDGWFRLGPTGALLAGRFLHNEAPPAFTHATSLDYHDLIEEIEWDATGWQDTWARTSVRYSDRQAAFKTLSADYVSSANRAVTQEDRRQTLDRPWICRAEQAAAHAAESGKIAAEPGLSGTLVVRAEKAAAIEPGALFRLTHDALGVSIACRCISKAWHPPPADRVSIRFTAERAISLLPYTATPDWAGRTPPHAETPERIGLYRILALPPALAAHPHSIAVLAARTTSLTTGLRVWMRANDASLFSDLGEQRRWAVRATLAADLSAGSNSATVTLDPATVAADLALITETLSEDDVAAAKILIFAVDPEEPDSFEIMALADISTSGGNYNLAIRRGRFGSEARPFTAGAEFWLIPRADLAPIWQPAFPAHVAASSAATFRLQALTPGAEADLSDSAICPDIPWTFTDPWGVEHRPSATWTTPNSSPYTLPASGQITPAATLADLRGNLIRVRLATRNEQTGVVTQHLQVEIPPTSSTTLASLFAAAGVPTPLNLGTQTNADQYFTLTLRMEDAAGNVVDDSRTLILPASGGGNDIGAVAFNPTGRPFLNQLNVGLTIVGSATQIHYAVLAIGSSQPVSYSTYFGTSRTITLNASRRIWARASNGTVHGPWQFQDYEKVNWL